MRRAIIAGNWKMNTSLDEAASIVAELAQLQPASSANDRVIIPPFPWIVPLQHPLLAAGFSLGAQNCATEDNGAFTGEVSAKMLQPYCSYVVVGHSERRHVFGEADDVVRAKLLAVLRNEMSPILCVGEMLHERDAGQAFQVVERQLRSALAGSDRENLQDLIVAYEPVWAIGTGRAATANDAQQMATHIRQTLSLLFDAQFAQQIRIQYGGSVNAANASAILSLPDIDGALVGGASLKADEFSRIIDAAPAAKS
ncbi:MAG TPA: triose-phosphate isomerase [Nitrolancea sp.]|nr:triose-phosphate isomerase [Nitrolancea sp.]